MTVTVRDEGCIRWIGLDRPAKRNAIDQAMADDLTSALADARRQPCVLIVHSTTPGIFAAGADIAEFRDRDADAALQAINAGLFERLEGAPLAGHRAHRRPRPRHRRQVSADDRIPGEKQPVTPWRTP